MEAAALAVVVRWLGVKGEARLQGAKVCVGFVYTIIEYNRFGTNPLFGASVGTWHIMRRV